jgi:Asp-tRNA(Asn)/Glu-tRNA(Gln) amidotransferase A subunit family amidase
MHDGVSSIKSGRAHFLSRQHDRTERKTVTIESEVLFLSIRAIASLYRQRKLSPVEVVDAALGRIEKLNPGLNAFVTLCAEPARQAAKAAEVELAKATDLPLVFGIPFSVKDTLPAAGVRTTFGGCPLFADLVPSEGAAVVENLLRQGAILLGKTNSPPLGWIPVTQNKLFGITPNPWDPTVTAGGSSGGAAVAAAAALAPINVGTDGGGSLRVPGSFTGTVGFKPSYGRVPNYPTGPNWGLQHIGPLARSVADAADGLDAMSATDERDPYSLPPASIRFGDCVTRDPAPLKILFCPDLGFVEAIDPEVVDVCRQAARQFSAMGHHVTEKALDLPSPMAAWQTLFVTGIGQRLGAYLPERADDIEDTLRGFIERGRSISGTEYYNAWLTKNDWWQLIRPVFEQYDVMLTPTVACLPFAIGKETVGEIAGHAVSFYGWVPFSAPFNMTGQPAISIPAGRSRSNLPIGLQIVGRRMADDTVLSLAAAYERAHPWPQFRV